MSRSLSAEQAELAVPQEMRQYARAAWTFLNNAGYINFGVAPAIAKEALETPQTRGSVIVIGAGMAGGSDFALALSLTAISTVTCVAVQ